MHEDSSPLPSRTAVLTVKDGVQRPSSAIDMTDGVEGRKEWKVEGRGSFHPKIPMKRAIFEAGGRLEGCFSNSILTISR
jgi:hypothetical protein